MRFTKHIAPASVLALALLSGCKGCGQEDASPPAASPDGGASTSPLRSGVKVPLPDGWSAQVAPDESFQAGPPGQPVFRVDLRRGEGEKMPTPDVLADRVREEMKGFELSLDQEEEEANAYSLLRVTVAPKLADGGVGEAAPAFFGARRVGTDLFLCASLPGASAEDVRLATEACRNIQVQPAKQ